MALYCVAYKSRYWFFFLQGKAVWFTLLVECQAIVHCTSRANEQTQRKVCAQWTIEHGKSQSVSAKPMRKSVNKWKKPRQGQIWAFGTQRALIGEKVWSFPLGNRKIWWKVWPGLETRTHLARSSDLDKMHRGQCLKHQQYQEAYISNHFHRWHQYIALWFRSGWLQGSYIKLSQVATTPNPVMHNHR